MANGKFSTYDPADRTPDNARRQQPTLVLAIVGAGVGAILVFIGLVVLTGQMAYYIDTTHWSPYSLLDLLKSPAVKSSVFGSLFSWIYRPDSLAGLHSAVVSLLAVIPAASFFISAGGFLLWRNLR